MSWEGHSVPCISLLQNSVEIGAGDDMREALLATLIYHFNMVNDGIALSCFFCIEVERERNNLKVAKPITTHNIAKLTLIPNTPSIWLN